jgi:aminobenzoyl-glutamate utilization protein B
VRAAVASGTGLWLSLWLASVADAVPFESTKKLAAASVDRNRSELTALSDRIWGYAETALLETRSAAALADWAEAQGFRVQRGVAELPTAFTAEFGSGPPVVAILGEFDALPGVSQQAQPTRAPLLEGGAGHGCGHNLFGAGSLGAANAIRELIAAGKLHGTIRFYGTPAEEAVGGKLYFIRNGLFKDVDVCLAWHPDSKTQADTKSTQALVDFAVEFHGRAAHAAYDPWNGRSAGDAAEIFTHAVNLMREHVKLTVRLHYAAPEGAQVPNVVPEHARVWMWVRDSKRDGVESVLGRLRAAAEGAALCAGVESQFTLQGGNWEMLVNRTGARMLYANLQWLGPVPFSAAEQTFARTLQRAAGVDTLGLTTRIEPLDENPGDPEGGSTDVADVSWNVPTLHVSVATAPRETAWHAWPVVACGGMSIGHQGMLYAAKVLAATAVDLLSDAKRREAVRAEFAAATQGKVYASYVTAGAPPVPTPAAQR